MRSKIPHATLALGFALAGLAGAQPATSPKPTAWQLDWVRDASFYQVFVRSFQDSNGDGMGDLPGLISRLDYLNDGDPKTATDLGVSALWLMPVFESPSYHGYDTTDYRKIDPDYGTLEDFDRLLREAHRRGLRVVIDLMINHTSREHSWFVESASSPSSAKRNWYVWRADDPGWTQPWGSGPVWHEKNGAFYYGIFWGGMPDLNFGNPAVRAEVKAIVDFWLERGVDGFRLDAARHLFANGPGPGQNDQPETHAFWRELAAHVRTRHPRALLLAENWTDTETIAEYFGSAAEIPEGDELPMSFNFPLATGFLEAVASADATAITTRLTAMRAAYPPGALDATFLTNHDQQRLASVLAQDPGKLRSAAALLLSMPGTPFVYYGEEVGLVNGPGGDDRQKRTPMPWDATAGGGFTAGKAWFDFVTGRETANVAAQTGDGVSLLAHYRRWLQARAGSEALRRGEIEVLVAEGPRLVFLRKAGGEQVLVAHNLGSEKVVITLPDTLKATRVAPLVGPPGLEGGLGTVPLELPGHASAAWKLGAGKP
jgi:alpha-amylase